jgi:hypothetical protein
VFDDPLLDVVELFGRDVWLETGLVEPLDFLGEVSAEVWLELSDERVELGRRVARGVFLPFGECGVYGVEVCV